MLEVKEAARVRTLGLSELTRGGAGELSGDVAVRSLETKRLGILHHSSGNLSNPSSCNVSASRASSAELNGFHSASESSSIIPASYGSKPSGNRVKLSNRERLNRTPVRLALEKSAPRRSQSEMS